MHDWHRVHAHEGPQREVEHRPVNITTVRIWAVEYDHSDIIFCARLHDIMKGRDIGIEAATNVLDVEDDIVETFELLGSGLFVLSIERDYRQSRRGVFTASHRAARFDIATKAVFGTENLDHLYPTREESVEEVDIGSVRTEHYRSLVCHDCHLLFLEQRQIGIGAIGTHSLSDGYRSGQQQNSEQYDNNISHTPVCPKPPEPRSVWLSSSQSSHSARSWRAMTI